MRQLEILKSHFAFLASSQGYISEDDYHVACNGVTDDTILDDLSNWLIAKEYKLVKGIGPQYQQEIQEKLKNPNVEDVKDTKHRTHTNKDKLQKSKKKNIQENVIASFHLNKVIDDMQEFEDEFLPAWKKWKASSKVYKEFLASLGITAQDFGSFEQAQRNVQQILESSGTEIPEDAYIQHNALQNEFAKIDPHSQLPIIERIEKAVLQMFDPGTIREVFDELFKGIQSGFERVPLGEGQSPTTPEEPMPSGTRMIEFSVEPEDSGLETASVRAKAAKAVKVATTVARIGYSDKERMNVKFDNDISFSAYIAETPMQKAAGLEVFDSLGTSEGLFFPFEDEGSVTFHMGSVAFPIDIVFLMDSPNGLEVGKIVANVQPGSPDWWSYHKTSAVLEVVGGSCKQSNIKIGSTCRWFKRVEAQGYPSEYNLSLPDRAGEYDLFALFTLLSEYHGGQGDPVYAVQSRESKDNISLGELDAVESLLEDIDNGKYMPGYPHGQLAPGDSPMGLQESEEYEAEQGAAANDMSIAQSWLPVIREVISENSPVEEEF